jgi:uncharacterized protein
MRQQLIVAAEFKLSSAGEPGTFTGYGNVFNNVDAQGDVVIPGAFTDDLRDRGSRRPLLWQHAPDEPIGFVDLAEDAHGLKITAGKLLLDVQRAKEAHVLMQHGVLGGFSIGFETLDSRPRRDGVREILSIKTWEVSAVTFPANALARIGEVRSDEPALRSLLASLRSANVAARTQNEARDAERLRAALASLRTRMIA